MRPFFLRSLLVGAALTLLPSLLAAQTTPAEKTAEQEFKNIQVFQGKPANELRPTMSFIASSLGVGCDFCHVQPFSADTNPHKATARAMVRMVYAINKDNFDGRNQINCYTCHQGHSRPNGVLSIAADEPAGADMAPGGRGPGPGFGPGGRGPGSASGPGGRGGAPEAAANLPTAQALLDKYTNALGGATALAGITSETVTSERVASGSSTPEEVVRADGKFALTDTRPGGSSKSGYDGTNYWSTGGRGGEITSDTIGALKTDVELYPGAGLKADGARVVGEQPVGDRTAYVVAVRSPEGVDRYYFDKETGLLLRHATGTPTFLGSLPLQVDYADYQAVDGVKLPFDVKWSTHERSWERKISAVKLNGTVDPAAFAAPAGGK